MKRLSAALVLIALLAAGVPCRAEPESEWNARLAKAKYSLAEASARGLEHAGPGFVFHAELEQDGDALVYSIDVAQEGKTCNVVLDAADGGVVEKEVEDEDHSADIAACQITLAMAIAKALEATPGKAVEAQLRVRSGKPVIQVKVFADGKIVPVAVDGESGKVLAAESRPPAAGGKKPGDESPAKAPKEKKPAGEAAERAFTDTFLVDPGEWSSTGVNPWFSLEPGTVLVLEGEEDGETVRLTIRVLDETRTVAGVETRVVEEREEEGGEVVEISRNYFAISKKTNSVYYFGEDSADYEDGKVKNRHGSWLAGEKDARFGLIMPGTPLLGARYYQEVAPGVALDRAEIVSLDAEMETPAGKFTNVLKTEESTPLERGREFKYYAAGVGLLRDGNLRLVRHGKETGK